MSLPDLIWGVIGLLLTVMVLSYLLGDNFLFRIAASIFIGVTAGFIAVLILRQILWPYLLAPLFGASWIDRAWVLIPLVLAVLLVMGQFPRSGSAKLRGLGRIPLAFLAGLTASLAIGGAVFGTMVPQIQAVVAGFDPSRLYEMPGQPWLRILDAVIMLVAVIGTLSYFHFGRSRLAVRSSGDHERGLTQRPRVFEILGKVGQVFIGMALGSVFAGIFSTALLALIDRLVFIGAFVSRLMQGGL